MIRVQQLRQKAELLRRVASIPTHGDGLIDRDLLVLADRLEEEADVRSSPALAGIQMIEASRSTRATIYTSQTVTSIATGSRLLGMRN